MLSAKLGTFADEIDVTYLRSMSATDLSAAAFEALPNGNLGDSIVQVSAREVTIAFGIDVTTNTTLEYTGTTPGVLTPQTVPINP